MASGLPRGLSSGLSGADSGPWEVACGRQQAGAGQFFPLAEWQAAAVISKMIGLHGPGGTAGRGWILAA